MSAAPHALVAAVRHEEAVRLMFEGLHLHYLECLASGRMDLWRKLGHDAIDLLSSAPDVPVARRADPAVLEEYLREHGTVLSCSAGER